MTGKSGKLVYEGERVAVPADEAFRAVEAVLARAGCPDETARIVADHLVDSGLSGVESHGVMRCLQYAEQFRSGYMDPAASLIYDTDPVPIVDGRGGIGIPAMHLAAQEAVATARRTGVAAVAIRNVGHTGRLGAYAERIAGQGCLSIIIGGGGRENWRQVAPYGGRKALLPTNPYCIGMPGGLQGPVVLDFATAMIAGGWIYAARNAGARLPEGVLIDPDGMPSTDPEDYFRGGAILPAGGPKGYAMAVLAELIGEAMLGPATTEMNWLMVVLDTTRYRSASAIQGVAEEILAELRDCPPAPGFDRVQVPGERESDARRRARAEGLLLPAPTWRQILDAADG